MDSPEPKPSDEGFFVRVLRNTNMLPQLFALAAIAREKLAEQGHVPAQLPLLAELGIDHRLALINRLRSRHGGAPITEDDYFADERRWVDYCYQQKLVRPRWMR